MNGPKLPKPLLGSDEVIIYLVKVEKGLNYLNLKIQKKIAFLSYSSESIHLLKSFSFLRLLGVLESIPAAFG